MAVQNIDPRRCMGCKTCVMTCPVDALRFNEDTNQAYTAYPEECQICNMCVNVCPVSAITLTSDQSMQVLTAWG